MISDVKDIVRHQQISSYRAGYKQARSKGPNWDCIICIVALSKNVGPPKFDIMVELDQGNHPSGSKVLDMAEFKLSLPARFKRNSAHRPGVWTEDWDKLPGVVCWAGGKQSRESNHRSDPSNLGRGPVDFCCWKSPNHPGKGLTIPQSKLPQFHRTKADIGIEMSVKPCWCAYQKMLIRNIHWHYSIIPLYARDRKKGNPPSKLVFRGYRLGIDEPWFGARNILPNLIELPYPSMSTKRVAHRVWSRTRHSACTVRYWNLSTAKGLQHKRNRKCMAGGGCSWLGKWFAIVGMHTVFSTKWYRKSISLRDSNRGSVQTWFQDVNGNLGHLWPPFRQWLSLHLLLLARKGEFLYMGICASVLTAPSQVSLAAMFSSSGAKLGGKKWGNGYHLQIRHSYGESPFVMGIRL